MKQQKPLILGSHKSQPYNDTHTQQQRNKASHAGLLSFVTKLCITVAFPWVVSHEGVQAFVLHLH